MSSLTNGGLFSERMEKRGAEARCMVVLERAADEVPRIGDAVRGPRARWRTPLVIGVGVTLVTYLGAGVPSYWGDEAASVLSAERSWPSLFAELSTVDAVHGLYYSLLHLWIGVFGSTEWSTRALSALGIGVLAAGVVVLGERWFDRRIGVLAGILIAVIPRAGVLAIETRGYAIAAAAAVWVTILFVRLVDRDGRRRGWILYGVAVAVSATFFLYLLLMPLVHLTVLLVDRAWTRHPRVLRRWLVSMVLAAVLALPIMMSAQQQKGQVEFLARRGYMTPTGWFVTPWFGHVGAAALLIPVLLIGIIAVVLRRPRREGAAPVIVWLLAPGIVLVLIDVLFSPTFNPRYLSFSLGAVAMLLASGVWAILDLARGVAGRRGLLGSSAVLIILGALLLAPEFVHERGVYAKDGGADGRAAAAQVASIGRPGDTVLFGTGTRPSRAPRLVYRLYPEAFQGMSDPQLITAAEDTDGLWDRLATVESVAPELSAGTVWLLETGSTGSADADVAALQRAGFTEVSRTDINRTVVYEFRKGTQS